MFMVKSIMFTLICQIEPNITDGFNETQKQLCAGCVTPGGGGQGKDY